MDLYKSDKRYLTIWFCETRVLLFELVVKLLPSLVKVLSVVFILLDCEDLLLDWVHSEGLFECEGIDFL